MFTYPEKLCCISSDTTTVTYRYTTSPSRISFTTATTSLTEIKRTVEADSMKCVVLFRTKKKATSTFTTTCSTKDDDDVCDANGSDFNWTE